MYLFLLLPPLTKRDIGGKKRKNKGDRKISYTIKEEQVRGLCKGEGGRREGGKEVNLHILERAGFFIKKRLKLIYACVLLTHCTL